ncbi:MAG: hypothetical protein H7832_13165, partial [Magnetococcus sp. DMHC-6]
MSGMIKRMVVGVLMMFVLAACGGGGSGEGTQGSSSKNTSLVDKIALQSSTPQEQTDGTVEVGLMAVVSDANSNLLSGKNVSFQTVNFLDATIDVIQSTTDSSGTAKAILKAKASSSIQNIQVFATSDSKSSDLSTIQIAASTSGGTVAQSVRYIDLLTSNAQIQTDGSTKVELMAVIRDSSLNLLSGVAVTFQS